MSAALLTGLLLLTACAAQPGLPAQEEIPVRTLFASGATRRDYFVESRAQALALIAQRRRYFELLIESARDSSYPLQTMQGCVDEQKVLAPFETRGGGQRLISFLYSTGRLGPVGVCGTSGIQLAAVILDYCPKLGAVVELSARPGIIGDLKRLNLCEPFTP
jgi:hypothetical protein